MPKLLIAARFIGWSAIALSICSYDANSQPTSNAQNPRSRESPASLPILIDQLKSVSILTLSPIVASPDPQVKIDPSQKVALEPDLNPLNSIALNAKHQVANTWASKHNSRLKPSTVANSNHQTNPNDHVGNIELEQLNNTLAIPKQSQQITKQPHQKAPPQNQILPPAPCRTFPCLVLSQDPRKPQNQFNNPIYKLTAYRNNTSAYIFQLDAVTGRAFTQARNRYQSNTEAPLPDGSYAVVPRVVNGTIREVGGTMVPIFPKPGFNARMRRTALGIHWDPSFDRDQKEDGTSGCIGLTNKNDYHRVRNFVLKYRPRSLEVQITQ